jgi:hypothetical protein
MAARRRRSRVVMGRLVRRDADDGMFDLEFWARIGAEGRFAAAWEMVREQWWIRGQRADQRRLQRSVVRLQRR